MGVTSTSRRKFLRATARSSVALPLLTSFSMVGGAVAGTVTGVAKAKNNLCLFEANTVMGADITAALRKIGLDYQMITLDEASGWHAMMDTLASARGRALAILGRPATVFAVRNMLEPGWRVVLEARHYHLAGDEMSHEFTGLEAPIAQLSGWLDRVEDPAQYAVVLASMRHGDLSSSVERKALDLTSLAWPSADLVSLLAWPKGAV